MNLQKLGRAILFPHIAIMIILVPISIVFLVYSLVFLGSRSAVCVISYVLSAYTLTVWTLKAPYLIRLFKSFKDTNRLARLWRDDISFKTNAFLYGALIWNTAYALLQLGMGFWHRSFWFFSLSGYYILLAVMRFFLLRHARKYKPGENVLDELKKYRACGIIFLVMNIAISLMVFFMIYWNRTFHHHEITAITLAAYTFSSFTLAIINAIKYRKYDSPVYSAAKAISLAAACVSLLILESTMMTTFGDGTMTLKQRRILLGISGAVISAFIISMAVYMILCATKRIRLLTKTKEH